MAENATHDRIDALVARIAERALAQGATVAVAESLTGGQLSIALAAGADSGTWYRGAVVAYDAEVKFAVLGVPRGPVVTAQTARAMAVGVRELLGSDVAAGITGVGGPGPEEGRPAGTVYLCALRGDADPPATELHCAGGPIEVLSTAIEAALQAILAQLDAADAAAPGTEPSRRGG